MTAACQSLLKVKMSIECNAETRMQQDASHLLIITHVHMHRVAHFNSCAVVKKMRILVCRFLNGHKNHN